MPGVALFPGCEGDTESAFTSEVEYYKYGQLSNIYNNAILPLNVAFVVATGQLEQIAVNFREVSTPEGLLLLQEQWRTVQLVWKQLELYDLGAVGDSFISFEINRWPSDTAKIDANMAGSDLISEPYIASLGSSSKGISAIEYLIFSENGNDTLLNSFINAGQAARKLEYLVALCENLKAKSENLKTLWEANREPFTGALENGISGSQNQVINAMVALTEEIIISKLGAALGDSNGGIIDPERLEAHRSNFSKDILQQHLTALKMCYTGDFASTPFRVGFDDFLVLIGSEAFSDKIIGQFAVCQQKLDAVNGPLENEIISNPQGLATLKDSFRDLLVLIKVDMANVLGSTITFNDNDGD